MPTTVAPPPPQASPAVRADADVSTVASAPPPPLTRVDGLRCPEPFADANVVLAVVGRVTLTACDLVMLRERWLREGRTVPDPHELLRALVDEAVLAEEATARGMEHEGRVVAATDAALAEAIVHDTALEHAGSPPDDSAVSAYYQAHVSDFSTPDTVHLREIVLATEADARAVLAASATVPFDALIDRTVTPEGRRDAGDLGFVPIEGNDRVSPAVAQAGFALEQPSMFAPDPVQVEDTVRVGRHHRPRRIVRWHVVQRLERVTGHVLPLESVERQIRHRLAYPGYVSARRDARVELLGNLRTATIVQIDARALNRIRLRRPVVPTRVAAP